MPTQPLRRCSFPNCRNRVKAGRCEEHQQKKVDDRLPSSQRGYDHRWRKYRAEYLAQNPLCVMCLKEGKYTPATVIDHIQPVTGGQKDPLFWRVDNHQALCRDCHSYKTRVIDKRGFGAKK
nr:MAG TPA: HNH endonuclease [Caudoviricetes sp.]